MAHLDRRFMAQFEEAIRREADAARGLRKRMADARRELERMDAEGMRSAYARARTASESLSRAGTVRIALTAKAAVLSRLDRSTDLATVARELGERGVAIREAGRELADELSAAAGEVAAQRLCTRYGNQLTENLLSLEVSVRGAHRYTRSGRLDSGTLRTGTTV